MLYAIALACAPSTVSITFQFFLPTQNGRIAQGASKLTPWFDNACDPAVYTVYGQMAQAIATGDETPESAMEQVREAAASLH